MVYNNCKFCGFMGHGYELREHYRTEHIAVVVVEARYLGNNKVAIKIGQNETTVLLSTNPYQHLLEIRGTLNLTEARKDLGETTYSKFWSD